MVIDRGENHRAVASPRRRNVRIAELGGRCPTPRGPAGLTSEARSPPCRDQSKRGRDPTGVGPCRRLPQSWPSSMRRFASGRACLPAGRTRIP